MKFHHLTRHQRNHEHQHDSPATQMKLQAAVQQQLQQQVTSQLQRQLHLGQFASAAAAAQATLPSTSDNEADDDDIGSFVANNQALAGSSAGNEAQGYYDYASDVVASQLQQRAAAMLHQNNNSNNLSSASNHQNLGSPDEMASQSNHNNNNNNNNSFLMDKNKKLFPQKLWELIHNPSIQHCLRWSQDGQRVYLNRNEFEAYYLKTPNNQFHTQKAISFVRQMNMYGFRKVDDCYYENDNFRRDQQHLLRNMIRRHPNKGLFVGLDHHQLVAAAAAAGAHHNHHHQHHRHLHQQQQQHHQHHHLNHHFNEPAAIIDQQKQRAAAEQALRLYYLNAAAAASGNAHQHALNQFHVSSLLSGGGGGGSNAGSNKQQHSSSVSMASIEQKLAHVAASSHHHNQTQHQHLHHHHGGGGGNQAAKNGDSSETEKTSSTISNANCDSDIQQQEPTSQTSGTNQHHQPKKSRLLNNLYPSTSSSSSSAATATATGANSQQQQPASASGNLSDAAGANINHVNRLNNGADTTFSSNKQLVYQLTTSQLVHLNNQDSMHSTSSVDTQLSTSLTNSGSAGSPLAAAAALANGSRLIGGHRFSSNQQVNHHRQQQQQQKRHTSDAASVKTMLAARHESVGAQISQLINTGKFGAAPSNVSCADEDDENDIGVEDDDADVLPVGDDDEDRVANGNSQQATDLSGGGSSGAAAKQAHHLHQTLVRTLLQLKQQQQLHGTPQDFLMNLQQIRAGSDQTRSLLESLASLSSVGTNSSIDPTSNSPTERTATPPSRSPSPTDQIRKEDDDDDDDQGEVSHERSQPTTAAEDNAAIALNLAKSEPAAPKLTCLRTREADSSDHQPVGKGGSSKRDMGDAKFDYNDVDVDDDVDSDHTRAFFTRSHRHPATREPPMDSARKVRRFLDNQMNHMKQRRCSQSVSPTRSNCGSPVDSSVENLFGSQRSNKRMKLEIINDADDLLKGSAATDSSTDSLTKSLIVEICERRGDQLNLDALREAARYTECFLEILIDDASLIARNSSSANSTTATSEELESDADTSESAKASEKPFDVHSMDEESEEKIKVDSEAPTAGSMNATGVIDASSLSLALKLVPTKLLAAIQQQQQQRQQQQQQVEIKA